MIAYHGTATANLPGIEQRGILPGAGKGADAWAAKTGNGVFARRNAKHPKTFIATDKLAAQQFASYTADVTGSEPVVLTLKIDSLHGWHEDEHSGIGMGAMWSTLPIPPQNILDIEPVSAKLAYELSNPRRAFTGNDDSLADLFASIMKGFRS